MNNRPNKKIYILNAIVFIGVLVVNLVVRSIDVIQVQNIDGEKAIISIKKYAEFFPTLSILSLTVLLILVILSFIYITRENQKNLARLDKLNTLISEVGLNRINVNPREFTDSDMQIIEAWNLSVSQIVELNEKRELYFKSMMHDLNTPIQILKMNAYMNSMETNSKYSTAIIEELEELGDRIQNYLIIEKITYFEKTHFESLELVEYVKQHIARYTVMNVDIKLDAKPKQINIFSDKRILNKILQNIIENAIKYSVDGKVCVHVEEKQISISNLIEQGKNLENIFIRREREYSSKGNGLGVAIINTYAKLIKLDISSKTEGNKFVVVIKLQGEKNE